MSSMQMLASKSPHDTAYLIRTVAPSGAGCGGVHLEALEETASARAFCANPGLLIMRHTAGPFAAEVYTRDRLFVRTLQSGGILIVPADSPFRVRLFRPGRNIYLTLRGGCQEPIACLPVLTAEDTVLSGLLDMAEELAGTFAHATNAALIDALKETLHAHLKSAYGNIEGGNWQRQRAQSHDSHSSAIITEAVNFMFRNIERSITLSDVGEHVGCSPSHLGRLFKMHLDISPHRYLLSLRIERARLLLASTPQPIAQLALECGFASQEHLTRHFRRICHTTPAAYRREHTRKSLPLTERYD